MIRLSDISLPPEHSAHQLPFEAARMLRIPNSKIRGVRIVRRSVDARKKPNVRIIYTIDVTVDGSEKKILKQSGCKRASIAPATRYMPPKSAKAPEKRPVVVGFGPGGMFAALILALAGWKPLVLERGEDAESRHEKVEKFFQTGELDTKSNVQFGEGGAGTFSDGKLTTGTHDPRIGTVLDTFIEMGAPEDIAHSFRPHVGTDVLRQVVRNIRLELIRLGCDVRFGHQLTGLRQETGRLTGLTVTSPEGTYDLTTDALVLAPGHSARDTFALLHQAGVPMERKAFAIGVRIEHDQAAISQAQYGDAWEHLPPSDYRLSCHLPSGRSAFSFCVCPGGQVVASASTPEHLVTNGMSYRARDGRNINGGFLVGVNPTDFGAGDVLAGVRFQEQWEHSAYLLGGGGFRAPAQLVGDFLQGRPSTHGGAIRPTYQPGVTWTDLRGCLPQYVTDTLRDALPLLDRKVHGFAHPEAVLTGVETRSSSPVKILRDEGYQCALRGIFPCGEGCGYAGGIMSAAVDGIRVAEAVAGQG